MARRVSRLVHIYYSKWRFIVLGTFYRCCRWWYRSRSTQWISSTRSHSCVHDKHIPYAASTVNQRTHFHKMLAVRWFTSATPHKRNTIFFGGEFRWRKRNKLFDQSYSHRIASACMHFHFPQQHLDSRISTGIHNYSLTKHTNDKTHPHSIFRTTLSRHIFVFAAYTSTRHREKAQTHLQN